MVVAETLPSGLRLVTEAMPHVRSVTVGVWLARGSRHESDVESGVAHFVEHMLFKGTTSRSAQVIAQTIDSIGGQLDAFTSKEYAGYYIKVLDEHLDVAIDLLSDMVMRPAFAPPTSTQGARRDPRRDQDGRGCAGRSRPRAVHAAVLVEASARPADPRHARDRRRRSPRRVARVFLARPTSRRTCWSRPRASRARAAAGSGRSRVCGSAARRIRRSDGPSRRDAGCRAAREGHRAESCLPRHAGVPRRRTTTGTRSTCSTRFSAAR